ncbi:DUF4097 domain-containing protein [Bacillus aquiflavi]|uniref:DUF4097 domain-containing protein n=1 Tax=Bacillus aquiflavi TaxID=2672567 RepID=A0A6B3VX17_9BACI|nr:DUF4097 domain-containing protein [Bacillus aquiflavi]MBA4537551.1 DUF4097 domain-containing protein [Bacillus aquiflavi]NEY81808.1 DUF4097 domain-containing protein [Bacillus aquiflavi]UAC47832.1 DUF4097 family beta strand repeat-containing protein [Bacillus aquiflavi]
MNEERTRILQMVKEGKLSVNEALTLLEELEKAKKSQEKKHEEIVNELSTVIDSQDKEKVTGSTLQSAADKIFGFVDTAISKIKELDLDFNFGKYENVSHVYEKKDVNFGEMVIDIANGSIQVIPWDQNDVRIECEAKVYRVQTVDEAKEALFQNVIFTIEENKLRFSTQQKLMKVNTILYVPQSSYERVRLRTFNGPISGEKLTTKDFKIKAANGKIDINQLTSKHAEIETANGHIAVANSQVEDFEAETVNGRLSLEGDFEKVDVQTFNGNIDCIIKGNTCKYIQTRAVTGAIDLIVPDGITIEGELKSNLGGFTVELDDLQIVEEKSEMAQKLFRFKTNNKSEQKLHVLADTKTGSITMKKQKGIVLVK